MSKDWPNIIKKTSKKWFEDHPDFNIGLGDFSSGEITLPNDKRYYRVPLKMWYKYMEELHGPISGNPFKENN